jgi:hypothetical protein
MDKNNDSERISNLIDEDFEAQSIIYQRRARHICFPENIDKSWLDHSDGEISGHWNKAETFFRPEKYFVKPFTFDLINALIGEIFKRWEFSKALILGILSKNKFIFAIFKKIREYF